MVEPNTSSEDSNLLDVCPRAPQDIITLSEAAWQYYASHLWYLIISIIIKKILFSLYSHHILTNFDHILTDIFSHSYHIFHIIILFSSTLVIFLSYSHNSHNFLTAWSFYTHQSSLPQCIVSSDWLNLHIVMLMILNTGADLSGGRCNGRLQRTRRVDAEVEIDLCGVCICIDRGVHIGRSICIRIGRGIRIRLQV